MPLGELRQLETAGLARNDILLAATSYAAAALGAEAELGTLEPGKFADLIVIEGDPLVDIGDLANVRCVIAKGEIVTGCSSGR